MNRDLRDRFDGAVGGDPGVPPGVLAMAAITEGSRMRRRHRIVSGVMATAVVLTAGGVAAANLPWDRADPAAPQRVTVAAAMMPASAPSCALEPVDHDATDLAVFLDAGTTAAQRTALDTALADDDRVSAVQFETREQAHQKFRIRWAHEPDLLAVARTEDFPESFRVRLTSPAHDAAVRQRYAGMAGVRLIIGRSCSPDAPVGGTL
ncbi:hypothetical protein Q0Z83_014630 [Actinoplanes sichuanensis]|uniref:Permease-like cell division protein FtsX n=1 Tax=Actinoplanes sichuanensis TaxID=512349 RepID=A0ABW4A4A8_9ACTN|nr:permease-like cell division protein FtsX [Actinoplanes sichuanensis]BEL03272.1 hypothetical protein Q0Z83_014630 [Actinoplanes sichuanensis]